MKPVLQFLYLLKSHGTPRNTPELLKPVDLRLFYSVPWAI